MIETLTPRDTNAREIRFTASDAPSDTDDATLEDAARHEQDYLRARLRDELGREPTDEELREWQREHTEGY